MRRSLVITVSAIFALGLVMIFNTTSAEILDLDLERSTFVDLARQLIYGLAGILGAVAVIRFGPKRYVRASPLLLSILTLLLLLCLFPGIGKEVNGSKRWIALGGFSFQPSEFVKYVLPAFFIYRYAPLKDEEKSFAKFFKIVLIMAVPILLILVEPNNGNVGGIVITLAALFAVMRVRMKYWAVPLAVFLAVGTVSALSLPYVRGRLSVYWNPETDIQGKGHQPYQAKIAAGSGGLLGKGPGKSLQKLSYLPEAQNDYIAAIYAEEFGFIGVAFLVFLYMLLAYLGFTIAYRAKEVNACYLASTVIFLISFQAFMNLGVVSGLLPSTGLNLPFFSQGGTSLIANLTGVGILWDLAEG